MAKLLSVVLREGIPPREYAFFSIFGRPTKGPHGDLLELRCSAISFSHPVYLEIDVPGVKETMRFHVPHQYVLLIAANLPEDLGVGFLRQNSPPESLG